MRPAVHPVARFAGVVPGWRVRGRLVLLVVERREILERLEGRRGYIKIRGRIRMDPGRVVGSGIAPVTSIGLDIFFIGSGRQHHWMGVEVVLAVNLRREPVVPR